MLDHRPLDGDVSDHLTRDCELGVGQVAGQQLGDAGGAGPGDPQVNAMPLTGERE